VGLHYVGQQIWRGRLMQDTMLNPRQDTRQAADRAARVVLMCFDVDGVMTDGALWYGPQGETFKRFNAHDGHGIKLLHQAGVASAIISGRAHDAVAQRARELGIRYVHQGVADKLACFHALLERVKLRADEAGFMGDDVVDVPVMQQCVFAATAQEAFAGVKIHAHWIASRPAGHGAVREVVEFILAARRAAGLPVDVEAGA
jgi:3-deoxy-D-manno-octulosonate 8-phosphate phosphatase (KDO 8-P phosphatase)